MLYPDDTRANKGHVNSFELNVNFKIENKTTEEC